MENLLGRILAAVLMMGASPPPPPAVLAALAAPADPAKHLNTQPKPASPQTAAINAAVYDMLDFSDRQEFEFATRGLIEASEGLEIRDADGEVVWSVKAFEFVNREAPDSANPSLWRHTQLNHYAGLFEVTDGIYQVRGYDMANVTFWSCPVFVDRLMLGN